MSHSPIIRVKSPANIAFIKYWGRRDDQKYLPVSDTISMNLSQCYTTVELEVVNDAAVRELYIREYKSDEYRKDTGKAFEKAVKFYHTVKGYLKVDDDFGFRLKSANSFPKQAGIASSASFFSALALAYTTAFGKKLSAKELSVLSRLSGSGSACRSIVDGYALWKKGTGSETSYAVQLAPPGYWNVVDLVVIVTAEAKKVTSTEAHKTAWTSSFYPNRLKELKSRVPSFKKAFKAKDFSAIGKLIEEDTLSMHIVMMTQTPPNYYLSGKTLELMKKTVALRAQGIEAYYSIDAGENIHIICEKKNERKVYDYFVKQPEVQEIIVNYPCEGTRLV